VCVCVCLCVCGVEVVLTKRKDDEDTSSTIYNAMDHRDPVLDFQNYVSDDERIVDEVCQLCSHVTRRLSLLGMFQTDAIVNSVKTANIVSRALLVMCLYTSSSTHRIYDALTIAQRRPRLCYTKSAWTSSVRHTTVLCGNDFMCRQHFSLPPMILVFLHV